MPLTTTHNIDKTNMRSPRNRAHAFGVDADGATILYVEGYGRGLLRGLIRNVSGTVNFTLEGAMYPHDEASRWMVVEGTIPDVANPGEFIEGAAQNIGVTSQFNLASIKQVAEFSWYRLTFTGGGVFDAELALE
jgi:hypothetical protein